jgi:hypothetical protein
MFDRGGSNTTSAGCATLKASMSRLGSQHQLEHVRISFLVSLHQPAKALLQIVSAPLTHLTPSGLPARRPGCLLVPPDKRASIKLDQAALRVETKRITRTIVQGRVAQLYNSDGPLAATVVCSVVSCQVVALSRDEGTSGAALRSFHHFPTIALCQPSQAPLLRWPLLPNLQNCHEDESEIENLLVSRAFFHPVPAG